MLKIKTMKDLKVLVTILFSTCLIFSCKKKEEATPAATTATPATPVHVNVLTTTINNQSWSMINNGYFISKFSTYYSFGGNTAFSGPKTSVRINNLTYPAVGTFTLGSAFSLSGLYTDINNVNYTSKTGTINVTTFDTLAPNQGLIKKFKATFSFKTDTVNNVSYDITNGVIDFEHP